VKHLKEKDKFTFKKPSAFVLDTFPNPGVDLVTLHCLEFTWLCPVTGQPDYGELRITYSPEDLCLESKSLKMYLNSFRLEGGFAEAVTVQISKDVRLALKIPFVQVNLITRTRGGISIEVLEGEERCAS